MFGLQALPVRKLILMLLLLALLVDYAFGESCGLPSRESIVWGDLAPHNAAGLQRHLFVQAVDSAGGAERSCSTETRRRCTTRSGP